MKRILILLMSVMSIICLIGFCGCNLGDSTGKETKESSIFNFYFATENSYGVKLADDVYLDKISIPSTYNGKPVNTILKNFLGNNDAYRLKELVLPSSIKYIEVGAFRYCSFTKVDYKGNVNSWCEIDGVKNLMNHLTTNGLYINGHLPTSVNITTATKVSDYAFYGCRSLTEITISDSVTSIGDFAFWGCTSLNEINIPDSVTRIGSEAFYNCPIEKATIPTLAISYIPKTSLKTVKISSGESIGYQAFCNCTSLTEISISNSVTSIGDYAFYNCSSLTEITIPNSVMSIRTYVFYGCSSLTEITIPNSVTNIGNYAFYGCSSLIKITIPNSVANIGKYAFYGCTSLTEITIPNSVTSIGDYAFYGCSSLTEITIPNSVMSIRTYVFYGCSSLTKITIPSSVTSTGDYAFSHCTSLSKVYYVGSKDAWNRISLGSPGRLTSATIYYYSETQPQTFGNYWHYDTDGVTILEW